MNYYDPNGKKYTNNGGRIYDDKGYYIYVKKKLFFFQYACFIYERNNYYRYFRYLFYKKSIELDTNLFAFFPEIWIRTIKGLFEYFKSSI